MKAWKETVAVSNDRLSVPWKVTDVAIATAVVFAGFFVFLLLNDLVFELIGIDEKAFLTPWLAALLGVAMLAAVWVFGIRKYRAPLHLLGLRFPRTPRSLTMPWVALIGSLAFTAAYVAVVEALGVDSLVPPRVAEDILGDGAVRVVNTVVFVGWAPFAEEVFFRGFLLAALVPFLGPARAAIVGSAVFAAAHLIPGSMIPIFVTGLLLSWLYLRSRSIWPPLVAHAAQNLIAVSVV